jgi:hypothetical protein
MPHLPFIRTESYRSTRQFECAVQPRSPRTLPGALPRAAGRSDSGPARQRTQGTHAVDEIRVLIKSKIRYPRMVEEESDCLDEHEGLGRKSDWPISASPESPDSQPTSQAHNVIVRRKRSTSRGAAMTPYLRVRRAVFHACWPRSTTSKASWSAGSVRLPGGEAQPRPAFCFRGPEIYRDPISDFIEIWPNWSAHGPPSWRLVHRANRWSSCLLISATWTIG